MFIDEGRRFIDTIVYTPYDLLKAKNLSAFPFDLSMSLEYLIQ